MTSDDDKISSKKLADALERDQRQERVEQEAALRREQEVNDRLAAELAAKQADAPPSDTR